MGNGDELIPQGGGKDLTPLLLPLAVCWVSVSCFTRRHPGTGWHQLCHPCADFAMGKLSAAGLEVA